MSQDGLDCRGVEKTLGHYIADDRSIDHHHVDLEISDQNKLSLDQWSLAAAELNLEASNKARLREEIGRIRDEVRERVWVARIISKNTWPTLFICGSDHIASVQKLFERLGMNAMIVHADFDP